MARDNNSAGFAASAPTGAERSSHHSRLDRMGIPKPLVFGFVAVLLFMVGDGVESGFIAPYMSANGAGSDVRASYVITTYGVAVMVASWLSGALSDLWGPRRVMMLGFVIWVVFDILFLAFALGPHNYALMFVFYGLRGFGYPLFAFGFLVWITATGSAARLGAAVGWFYFAFTGGLPTLGSLFSSVTDPVLGQYGTLWAALVIIGIGGAFAFFGIRERTGFSRLAPEGVRPVQSLLASMTIAYKNPKIGLGTIVRVINTAPEFGFLVFLPTFFADEVGFGTAGWLRLLFILGATNIFFNLIFGVVSDRIGWQRTISIFGGFGCAISTLVIYFVPRALGGNYYWVAVLCAAFYGATLAGFVPISALMPSLAPENKGGAMACLNFGAGAAAFVGPGIVSLFLGPLGREGVIFIFAGLYVVAAILVFFLRLPEESKLAIQRDASLTEITRHEAEPQGAT